MNLTEALRKFVREQYGLAADATDDVIRAEISKRTASGELKAEKLNELLAEGNKSNVKEQLFVMIKEEVASATAPIVKGMADISKSLEAISKMVTANPPAPPAAPPPAPPVPELSDFEKQLQEHLNKKAGGSDHSVKVISAHKQYDTARKSAVYPDMTKSGTIHPKRGQQAVYDGRNMNHGSDLDKALCGVYFKWQMQSQLPMMHDYPRSWKMTDHDKELLQYMVRECPWNVDSDKHYCHGEKLPEHMQKDILDDGASGGTFAVPVVFDDAIVMTPVLFGELFPLVEVVNIPRGRLIDGSTISNPTITSGTAEGTAIVPFSTASFIGEMDTTIYPAVSAVYLGLDFESDTPIQIGNIITMKWGEKVMEWLDEQIAIGDGVVEPQGFFNAAGITTVVTDNGVGGPPTVGDYEELYFTMNKAFRSAVGGRVCYVANDTTYSRSRSIPVGQNDARRVFGMTHQDYMLLNLPYKVQNSIGNSQIGLVNLGGYRMYRRLGMTIRSETAGNYLALRNERLLTLRMRWGGRLTLGGYAVVTSTAQA